MKQITLIAFLLVACLGSSATAGPITLTKGTLIGIDFVGGVNTFRQYTTGGTEFNTEVSDLVAQGIGVQHLDASLYVADSTAKFGTVDLVTGNVPSLASLPGGISASNLGSNGTNLLSIGFSSSVVQVFTPAGSSITTISLSNGKTGWVGIDGSSDWLILGNDDGLIYIYDSSGTLVSSFDPDSGVDGDIPSLPGTMSGIAYDPFNDHIWASYGFGATATDTIRQYQGPTHTLVGKRLSLFSVPGTNIGGLDFIMLVPEPSSLLLFGMGATGLLVYRWRRRKRPAA